MVDSHGLLHSKLRWERKGAVSREKGLRAASAVVDI